MSRNAEVMVKLEEVRTTVFQRQYLQTRLSDIFLSIAKERPDSFYTKRFPKEKIESLVFFFDNGIDPDPHFSGVILGRLFVDEKNNLSLATWPLEKEIESEPLPWRKEILYPAVETIEPSFFGKTQKEKFSWETHWQKGEVTPPLMVRIELKTKEQKTSFAWFL